jgi:hypothetical protein
MAKVSKLIFGAAIAAASIATPALAAHNSKPVSAHYVTRSSQVRGLYDFVPARGPSLVPARGLSPLCPGLPACDPATGISYPGGEPGGAGG